MERERWGLEIWRDGEMERDPRSWAVNPECGMRNGDLTCVACRRVANQHRRVQRLGCVGARAIELKKTAMVRFAPFPCRIYIGSLRKSAKSRLSASTASRGMFGYEPTYGYLPYPTTIPHMPSTSIKPTNYQLPTTSYQLPGISRQIALSYSKYITLPRWYMIYF